MCSRGVVVAADDDVAGAHLLVSRDLYGGGGGIGVGLVQAAVDGVGDFPLVAEDGRVVAVSACGDVGPSSVVSHRDRITGV